MSDRRDLLRCTGINIARHVSEMRETQIDALALLLMCCARQMASVRLNVAVCSTARIFPWTGTQAPAGAGEHRAAMIRSGKDNEVQSNHSEPVLGDHLWVCGTCVR